MDRIDRLLGPMNPNKTAAKTAAPPKSILVVNATEEQCASVCEAMIKDNHWIIYGLVEDVTHPVARSELQLFHNTKTSLLTVVV